MSIGEVLSLLQEEFPNVTISKIRFLESQGLLNPERTPSGYRKFYEPDVERLRWILRQQREQYLPLKVIKGRLGGEPDPDDPEGGGAVVALAETSPTDEHAPAAPAMSPSRPAPPIPSPVADMVNPLQVVRTGVSMTLEELSTACGLSKDELGELQRYGLIAGRP